MNTALIIDEDTVTIVEISSWNNIDKNYIKLITTSGKILICSAINIKLTNRTNRITDEELVINEVHKYVNIKYYEQNNTKKLVK